MRINAPCKDCKKKFIGCHSSCEDYIEFKKDRERIMHERYIERRVADDLVALRKTRIRSFRSK